MLRKNSIHSFIFTANISLINDEEESEEDVPTVMIGNKSYPLTEVMDNAELIQKMQPHEKDRYIEIYQEYFQDLHD
jgi:transcription initiation factor TFIIE subunit alpha